jgi:hypothetical protein
MAVGSDRDRRAGGLRVLHDGIRKDGSPISEMMPWKTYGQMSDTELKAVWAYLRTVREAKGNH